MTTTATLDVAGMSCASGVAPVSKAARGVPGMAEVAVNLAAGRANVDFDAGLTEASAATVGASVGGAALLGRRRRPRRA